MLDRAIPPDKKSGPKQTCNVLLALVVSTILGVFLAFGAEFWVKNKKEFRKILSERPKTQGPMDDDKGKMLS